MTHNYFIFRSAWQLDRAVRKFLLRLYTERQVCSPDCLAAAAAAAGLRSHWIEGTASTARSKTGSFVYRQDARASNPTPSPSAPLKFNEHPASYFQFEN